MKRPQNRLRLELRPHISARGGYDAPQTHSQLGRGRPFAGEGDTSSPLGGGLDVCRDRKERWTPEFLKRGCAPATT